MIEIVHLILAMAYPIGKLIFVLGCWIAVVLYLVKLTLWCVIKIMPADRNKVAEKLAERKAD